MGGQRTADMTTTWLGLEVRYHMYGSGHQGDTLFFGKKVRELARSVSHLTASGVRPSGTIRWEFVTRD